MGWMSSQEVSDHHCGNVREILKRSLYRWGGSLYRGRLLPRTGLLKSSVQSMRKKGEIEKERRGKEKEEKYFSEHTLK